MDQADSVITNINQISSVPNDYNASNLTKRQTKDSSNNDIENILTNQSTVSANSDNKASKRPKNTALKQQRLPAWQPILTAKTVFPLFFGIGVLFLVLGGILFHFSDIVNEFTLDYTDCNATSASSTTGKCADNSNLSTSCVCTVSFTLDKDFEAPVYLYYGLKNFYQNHRRYVKSRDDNQLLGNAVSSLNSECSPYDKSDNGSFYAPCGAIANSLFSDSFTLNYQSKTSPVPVPVIATGIAWTTDKNVKFKNPSSWENTIKPKNWKVNVQDLSSDPDNTGYKNEDLIVWMRTAALPSFRKLYRRVNHSVSTFSGNLPAGNYTVTIDYSFPVTVFNGRKTFIISTTTWIGGKNPFLGIAYLTVGSLCIVLGVCFLVIHFKFARNSSKSMDDFTNSKGQVATVEMPDKN